MNYMSTMVWFEVMRHFLGAGDIWISFCRVGGKGFWNLGEVLFFL